MIADWGNAEAADNKGVGNMGRFAVQNGRYWNAKRTVSGDETVRLGMPDDTDGCSTRILYEKMMYYLICLLTGYLRYFSNGAVDALQPPWQDSFCYLRYFANGLLMSFRPLARFLMFVRAPRRDVWVWSWL